MNRVLEKRGKPKVERLGQLFNEVADVVLGTYRELDTYGERKSGRYWETEKHFKKVHGYKQLWMLESNLKAWRDRRTGGNEAPHVANFSAAA